MGKKTKPPKPPNLQPITDAQLQISREANDLAREQMGMSKEQFAYFQENAKEELTLARQQADRLFEFQNKAFESDEEAKQFARQVGQTQIDSMNLQMDYAKRDRERYEGVFLPMQDRYIAEAEAYDTAARREEAAGAAMADTQRQAEAARANADQRLRSMGLDPSQMRSASLLQTQDVMGAAQQAAAANQERLRVENQGRAMRADAMNLGMGLPAQAAAGFGGAGAAGQGALGAGQAGQQAQLNAIQGGAGVGGQAMGFRSGALNNLSQLTGSPMQWANLGNQSYGTALGGYGSAAGTMNQGFQNQMNNWQAGQQQSQQMISNIMGAAGMAASIAEGGPVGRHYAEGGDVKNYRYYAEGDPVAPRTGFRPQPGAVPGYNVGGGNALQMGTPLSRMQGPDQGRLTGRMTMGGAPERLQRQAPVGGISYAPPMPNTGGFMPDQPPRRQLFPRTPGDEGPPMQRVPNPIAGGLMPPGQYGVDAQKQQQGRVGIPTPQPTGGPIVEQKPIMAAEGGFQKWLGAAKEHFSGKEDLTTAERLRKGLMLASMAPENSWAGGQLGAGQYMDKMSSLANKDYMNPKVAPAPAAAVGAGTSGMLQPQQDYQQMQQQPMYAAEGGQSRGPMRARGAIPTRQSRDEIAAYLAEGEYVLPADVVRALGIEKLDKMVAKYHRDNA